ncbi:hypothetical protein L9F63_022346 [Diploptera punctata]|uniref:Uroporphyrinogen-III synthase n=1 Tax=Diploptera punctata TaxID=6984 RepID=A0AAD7ZM93_DIPPU|nr:hypothetical protein L9F63_022346 [Diploptera punctata]
MFKAAPDYSEIDYFEEKLKEAGYETRYVNVIEFEYCNLDVLEGNLKKAEEFAGLIFTSPRGVKAVSRIPHVSDLMVKWQKLTVFSVGEETRRTVMHELALEAQGCEAGNSNSLADIILQKKYVKPFLFPCGNLKHDTLPRKLNDGRVNIIPVTVYETKTHHLLEQTLQDIVVHTCSFPQIVIYFSPSGVRSTLPILLKLGVPLHLLKLIAIGPTTEKSLLEYKLEVSSVAKKPTPEYLLEAVNRCCDIKN